MKNIKLTIEYDGTNFHGWQKQPDKRTVQEEIETVLAAILKEEVNINGAGRTDAGVHAIAQVANFHTEKTIKCKELYMAINSIIPKDITILNVEEVDESFHARYSCKEKTYRYMILNRTVRDPFYVTKAWHFPYLLDTDAMNKAASDIIGEKDFSSFMAQGSPVSSTVRNVKSCYVERNGDIVYLYITANGFLYNMVRIVTGTLAAAGTGKLTESVKDIIASKDRTRAGITAPPQGLYLYEVKY